MRNFFRFLCIIMMICYFTEKTYGADEYRELVVANISMWVGENYTIDAPTVIPNTNTIYCNNYTWNFDSEFFLVEYPSTNETSSLYDRQRINITVSHPFQGTKSIVCIAYNTSDHPYLKAKFIYNITCNPVNVALYPTMMSLNIGESQTLQWQFSPNNSDLGPEISFSSSNLSVAEVDLTGKVIAKGLGNTTITATTNYGTTATCEVTVNPMPATSISLNQSVISLPVGSTQTLTATVLPADATDKSVTWTTSDESIATVDATGTITGIATGNATITATTNDGTNLSATCAVNVTAVQATSISIDHSEAELHVGETIKLTATVLPSNASQRVMWSSSDPAVARVVGGTVYALDWGECLITATSVDNSSISANCLIYVLPEQQGGTGCDVNGDGTVDVSDVNKVINHILGKD